MKKQLLFFLLICCFGAISLAQKVPYDAIPSATDEIFISNIQLKSAPGDTFNRVNIHIKHGVIKAVGDSISVPVGAMVIEGDSLFAYPAWISMGTFDGVKKEKSGASGQRRPSLADLPYSSGNPPAEEAGITPWLNVIDKVDSGSDQIPSWRNQGFAALHILPQGRMLPGKGCLISTRSGDISDIQIKNTTGMFGQSKGSGKGLAPSTTIGVYAKWSDLINQARQAAQYMDNYTGDPSGLPRPSYKKEVEAMIPVANRSMEVYYLTPGTKDLYRIQNLTSQLKVNATFFGLQYFFGSLDVLKETNRPIVVDLKRPDEDKKKKELPAGIDSVEYATMESSKQEFIEMWKDFPKNLAAENIDFGFSMLEMPASEIYSSLKKVYKTGISEDDLLSAVTTFPASLLGISKSTGTLSEGKAANMILSDGPVFEEDTGIKHMIVDGFYYEVPEKKKKSRGNGNSGDMSSVLGTWNYSFTIEGETQEGYFTLERRGNSVSGEVSSPFIPINPTISNVEFDGTNLSFEALVDEEGIKVTYYVNGKVDGDKMNGKLSDESGTVTVNINAVLVDKPE